MLENLTMGDVVTLINEKSQPVEMVVESVDLDKNQVTFTNGITFDDDCYILMQDGTTLDRNVSIHKVGL